MNKSLLWGVLVCAQFLCRPSAGADDALVKTMESVVRQAHGRLARLQAGQAADPAAAGVYYAVCIPMQRKALELYEQALAAAKAGDTIGSRALGADAAQQKRLIGYLSTWRSATYYAARYAKPDPRALAEEIAYRRRLHDAYQQVARTFEVIFANNDAPDANRVREVALAAQQSLRKVYAMQNVLRALQGKRQLLRRRDAIKDQELQALFAERIALEDAQIDLLKKRAALDRRKQAKQWQENQKEYTRITKKVQRWEPLYRARKQEVRFKEEMAEAPPELRALLKEIMGYRRQAVRIRARLDAREQDPMQGILLGGKALALEEKAGVLEDLLEARRELANRREEAKAVQGSKSVKAILAVIHKDLVQYEKIVRTRAAIAAAAMELEARAEALLEAGEDFAYKKLDDAFTRLDDAIDDAGEVREQLGKLGDPVEAQALVDEINNERADFDDAFAELNKQAARHVGMVRAQFNRALGRARQGLKTVKAGKLDAAAKEFTAALETFEFARKLKQVLSRRDQLEKRAAGLPAAAKDPAVRKALAAFRKRAEEATRLEIKSSRLQGSGAKTDAIVNAVVKAAEADANVNERAQQLDALLKKLAKPKLAKQPEKPQVVPRNRLEVEEVF